MCDRPAQLYPERTTSIVNVLLSVLMPKSGAAATDRLDKGLKDLIGVLDSFISRQPQAN